MSASKLLIRKFEDDGVNFKSLQVTTVDDGGTNLEMVYGDWLDGKMAEKKKDPDKSSRLVVKIASGNDIDKFNLGSSAKAIDGTEVNIRRFTEHSMQLKPLHELLYKSDKNGHDLEYNSKDQTTAFQTSLLYNRDLLQQHNQTKRSFNSGDYMSPLEYSLEKVKENNARIMENIHMLNRTLDYTKSKEILDIFCPKPMRSYYPCHTCGKCFVYETGLRRHYFMRHAATNVQPSWQVVWTCIQCFQVWPRQDQALNHSVKCCKTENKDSVREIKTSSLLQCEFCEKVYTSIPRLLRHSKLHTTSNNYECNACEMVFSSYKLAEQHWMSCPWLKMSYSFSLPKLLLCNACDRKFRNYEQLYNHRYKVGHFMTKTHCNPYSVNSLGVLVYQCEMCAVWYSSVESLKAHKIEHHPKHDFQSHMVDTYNDQNFNCNTSIEICLNQNADGNIQEL